MKVIHAIIGFRMMSRGTVLMVEVIVMVQDLSSAARLGLGEYLGSLEKDSI